MGRALQDCFMAEERSLPPGDVKRAKVAPPMEHGATEEIVPVKNSANNTPHF